MKNNKSNFVSCKIAGQFTEANGRTVLTNYFCKVPAGSDKYDIKAWAANALPVITGCVAVRVNDVEIDQLPAIEKKPRRKINYRPILAGGVYLLSLCCGFLLSFAPAVAGAGLAVAAIMTTKIIVRHIKAQSHLVAVSK